MMQRARDQNIFIAKLGQVNWVYVLLVGILTCVGFAMMYSAGGGHFKPWALPQIYRGVAAFIGMLMVAIMPIRTLLRYSYVIYAGCILMLIAVEVAGHMGMGAQRWVSVGFINIQPSELMKIALVLALARYFHGLPPEGITRRTFLIPPLILIALPAVLILKQPNLGTTTILCAVGAILFFMAGVKIRYFVILGLMGIAALPVAWHFMHDYQKQRVMTFLEPEKDPLGAGYNIMQSMIAIGSGGLFGKGYLQGSQGQLDFLPEKQTDFIFTMTAEEMGFVGGALLLLLYGLILAFGVAISIRCRNHYGALLAMGVTSMLFVHICINVAMVMGMIPVVGVPLPLLSYGGSITVTMLLGFGLVLNAYVHRDVVLNRGAKEGF